MRGKVLFVTGVAVGYVFGARAGRKRYEQMKSMAIGIWNTAPVQNGIESAKDFALTHVGDVSDAVLDATKKVIRVATQSAQRGQAVIDQTADELAEVVTEATAPKKTTARKAPARKTPSSRSAQARS